MVIILYIPLCLISSHRGVRTISPFLYSTSRSFVIISTSEKSTAFFSILTSYMISSILDTRSERISNTSRTSLILSFICLSVRTPSSFSSFIVLFISAIMSAAWVARSSSWLRSPISIAWIILLLLIDGFLTRGEARDKKRSRS